MSGKEDQKIPLGDLYLKSSSAELRSWLISNGMAHLVDHFSKFDGKIFAILEEEDFPKYGVNTNQDKTKMRGAMRRIRKQFEKSM